MNSSFGIQRGSNPEFERNRTKIADFSLNNRKRFRALRASGAREAGFFFMDQNHLPRRFQRAIARPQAKTRSAFLTGRTHTNLTFDPVELFPGLRTRGAREAGFFFMDQYYLPRQFL